MRIDSLVPKPGVLLNEDITYKFKLAPDIMDRYYQRISEETVELECTVAAKPFENMLQSPFKNEITLVDPFLSSYSKKPTFIFKSRNLKEVRVVM